MEGPVDDQVVCSCKYGRLLYHVPLPPRPTDAFLEERAEREHPEMFGIEAQRKAAAYRDCPDCGEYTDDFDRGEGRCRACNMVETRKVGERLAAVPTLRRPERKGDTQ